jgi:hypothetical protein
MTQGGALRGSFRERIEACREVGWRPVNLGDDFQPVHVQRAAIMVVKLLGEREPRLPQGLDLDELAARITQTWRESHSLAGLSKRDLRLLPWVLFYPPGQDEAWLGGDRELLRDYRGWLAQGHRSRAVVALLYEYLAAYPRQLSTFDQVRTLLREAVLRSDAIGLHRWRERCTEFLLLEEDGPERMVTAWWDSPRPVEEFLAGAGFAGGLAGGQFLEATTVELLERLRGRLARGDLSSTKLARGLTWVEDDGRLRFETLRIATAEALLVPFEAGNPTPEIEETLRPFFLRCLGDPRLPRATGWANVPDPIRSVLRRWLVRLDLDDFFRLLDKTAREGHWRYRKAFWRAYLQRDLITDTWIVLGPEAGEIARRTFEHGDKAVGRLRRGTGVLGNHSVLLLRLGRMTVAEWSHMGTCRFWLPGNMDAPAMYRQEYRREELVHGPDFEQRHHGPERGTWQARIADWISRNTGVRVGPSDYMPSGRRGRR